MFTNCGKCGKDIPRSIGRCPACGVERSHQDCYPDQYGHPLCGRPVQIKADGVVEASGVVERVVNTRFGPLAYLNNSGDTAYCVADCHPVRVG